MSKIITTLKGDVYIMNNVFDYPSISPSGDERHKKDAYYGLIVYLFNGLSYDDISALYNALNSFSLFTKEVASADVFLDMLKNYKPSKVYQSDYSYYFFKLYNTPLYLTFIKGFINNLSDFLENLDDKLENYSSLDPQFINSIQKFKQHFEELTPSILKCTELMQATCNNINRIALSQHEKANKNYKSNPSVDEAVLE